MKPFYLMMTVLTVAVLSQFSASAACGGGGWSKSNPKPNAEPAPLNVAVTEVSAEVVDLGETAQVMSVKAGPVRTIASMARVSSAKWAKGSEPARKNWHASGLSCPLRCPA